jgi:DNA helicase-2/ATP-dependent DNA helicase PcrA
VQVSTFHAFGKQMVEECSPRKATFSEWKRKHLVDSLLKERGLYSKGVAKTALSLVKLSMVHIANTGAAIEGLVSEHEMEWPAELHPVELVRQVQDRALSDFLERGHYDYDDMLYLPLKLGYGFESMDVVLVDETQDFSRLQHRLVKHVIGRRGRVVLVGDRAQAIYEFTGADAEGLDRAQDTFNALPLRLTVTFRCPKSHVALASEFSDLIVAADGAAEGEVSTVTEDELLGELQPEDLVMARTNAPMISLALRCAQQGLNVEVMGHDLVAKLEGHVTRCFAYPFELADIEPRLQEYGMALLQEHYEQGVRGKRLRRAMQSDVDLLACIAALAAEVATRASRAGHKAQGREITAQVGQLFHAKGKAVRFCTVHKAKGLEARRVALLGAAEIMEAGRQQEEKGDAAIAFVALTRAKERLWLVNPLSPLPEGEDGEHE